MTAKNVLILGNGPDARQQRAVIATLPNDFVDGVTAEGPEIVLISGRDGNADTALERLEETSADAFVTSPSFLTDGQRARLAASGRAVTIALAYGPALVTEAMAGADEPAILDLTAMVRDGEPADLREALLTLLALGRDIIGEATAAQMLHRTAASIVLEMTAPSGLNWRISAHRGLRDGIAIDHVARATRFHVAYDREPHGRPAVISTCDAAGTHVDWPVYQDSYRAAWSMLAQGETGQGYTLDLLAKHLAILDGA